MLKKLEDVNITDDQAEIIQEWIDANKKVPGGIGDYPLGHSYIDSRANGGRGITERRSYVKLDHEVAMKVPELRNCHVNDIREFMFWRERLENSGPGMR
jgi:hypothetical protein